MFNHFANSPSRQMPRSYAFNDFTQAKEIDDFTVSAIASGTAAIASGVKNGVLRITANADSDNSGANIQDKKAWIGIEAGKSVEFTAFIKGSEATQSDWIAGLTVIDTTLIGGMTDGIYFRKADGAATVECVIERDSTETTSGAVWTFAADTWYRLGIIVTLTGANAGKAAFWVDNVCVAEVTVANLPISSEEFLVRSVEYMSGDASGTDTFDIDLLAAGQER